MDTYGFNSSAGNLVTALIRRCQTGTPSSPTPPVETILVTRTRGTVPGGNFVDWASVPGSPTVDNVTCSYHVRATLNLAIETMALDRVRVEYLMPSPLIFQDRFEF